MSLSKSEVQDLVFDADDMTEMERVVWRVYNQSERGQCEELAEAIENFADWQWSRYAGGIRPESSAGIEVGKALWEEVSKRVQRITGKAPAHPPLG